MEKKDWEKLLKKAKSGNTESQYDIAVYYESVITPPDEKEAFKWYCKAHEKNHLGASVRVADYLSEGVIVKKDEETAIKIYEEAIRKGSGDAANNLATVYRDKYDFEKAFELLIKTRELSRVTPLELPLHYLWGIGCKKDKKKAFKLFEEIASDTATYNFPYEVDAANFYLATLYLEGEIVEKSIEKARTHLEVIDESHDSAQELLLTIGRSNNSHTPDL